VRKQCIEFFFFDIAKLFLHSGDPYDNPPYVPGGVALNTTTVSLRAITNGTVMYNTHNLYAYNEGIATMSALQQIRNERSMVISRASYPGHGVHAR